MFCFFRDNAFLTSVLFMIIAQVIPVHAGQGNKPEERPQKKQDESPGLSIRLAPLLGTSAGRPSKLSLHKEVSIPAFYLIFENKGPKKLWLPNVSELSRTWATITFELRDTRNKPVATIKRTKANVFPTFFELQPKDIAVQPIRFSAQEWKTLQKAAPLLPSSHWQMRATYEFSNGKTEVKATSQFQTFEFRW